MFCPPRSVFRQSWPIVTRGRRSLKLPDSPSNALKGYGIHHAFHLHLIVKGSCIAGTRCSPFRFIEGIILTESKMDRWLNNAPALAFIKDLSTWLIINDRCEPILWSDDDKELAWLFACVLECGANNQTKLVVKNAGAKTVGQVSVRRTSRDSRGPAVVLPMRSR